MTPRTKASVDVDGADGVGCAEAVAGADEVALVSVTGTVVDLRALGTLANASVVVLPFLSCMSSCSCSTAD